MSITVREVECSIELFFVLLNQDTDKLFMPFQRIQYPIQLAFAMTCNKAQGQTLKQLGLYLPIPVFTHGQLYVALSRPDNPDGLKILIEKTPKQGRFDGYDGIY
eukprot:515518_1